jgi:ABC-type polysaccharide/polyol phosphate transport system ATPase subunit
VIDVRGVSKVFAIPHQKRKTVFDRVFGRGHYTFETLHALRDVSLRVEAGEFVGIVGRNGCGKSTLLRIVSGIYPPTAGTVRVDGRVAPILELGVGFNAALTVRDNVFLYGVLLGVPRRRLEAELPAVLERAGIGRFEDARLETLSTGMRARLAFTVALLAEAPILLVDEALAVGDEKFQAQCLSELRRLKAEGRTAILVSHDFNLLNELCPRLVLLEAGTVREDGPPARVIERYRSLS